MSEIQVPASAIKDKSEVLCGECKVEIEKAKEYMSKGYSGGILW